MNFELRLLDIQTGEVSQHVVVASSEQDARYQAQATGLRVLSALPKRVDVGHASGAESKFSDPTNCTIGHCER